MKININNMKAMVARHYELDLKVLGTDQKIYNFLEDVTYEGKAGEIVLRGTVGEEWIIPLKKLSKYMNMDGSDINLEAISPDMWIRIQTRESDAITWMVQIPVSVQGEVQTERGDILKVNNPKVEHGDGDWVCCCDDGGKPTLEWGAWVVNGNVVTNTYKEASI